MTDKKPYLASLKGRGMKGTGVTDTIAQQMSDPRAKGRYYMVLAEVQVDAIHDRLSGQKIADLAVTQFWPVTDTDLEKHLRDVSVRLAAEADVEGEGLFEADGPAPKVADILANGQRFIPHPFLPVDLSDDNPICDVCGNLETAGAHAANRGDAEDQNDDETDPDDTQPHDFISGAIEGICAVCEEPIHHELHRAHDDPDTDAA